MGAKQQAPQNSNEQIDEKGLLQPEADNHTIYVMPPDASPEEQHAIKTLSRINDQLEKSSPPAEKRAARAQATRKRPSRRRRRSATEPSNAPAAVHESRCTVCRHPFRADIEQEFVQWHSPRNIGEDYGICARAIYRHAHALDLFAVRDRNLRFALGNVIDRADRIGVMTPDSIIKAIHAYARINSEGQWTEPPRYLVISQGLPVPLPANAAPIAASGQSSPTGSPSVEESLPLPQLPPAPLAHNVEPAPAPQVLQAAPSSEEKKIYVPRAWPNPNYMVLSVNQEPSR